MGWWDYGIMGGDTPLDIKGSFLDALGRVYLDEMDYDTGYWALGAPSGLQILQWTVSERERWMSSPHSYMSEEYFLVAPVVAYQVMELGLVMDPVLRNIAMVDLAEEIKRINEGRGMFNEDSARKTALEQMLLAVQSYVDGEKNSEPDSPGLFEVMANSMGEH